MKTRLLLAFLLAFCMPTMAQKYYQNPLMLDDTPDPTVWAGDDGRHYLYYTSGILKGAPLYATADMVTWQKTSIDPIPQATREQIYELGKRYANDVRVFFAPTVTKVGDRWNMYISMTYRGMVVLTSKSATGPFTFEGAPYVLIDNSITGLDITNEDSWVSADEQGVLHLFWGSHGRIYEVPLTADGLHLAPRATFTHVVGPGSKAERWAFTGEGIMMHKRGPWWYAFFSQGMFNDDTYTLYVARSKSMMGPFVDRDGHLTSHLFGTGQHALAGGTLILKTDGSKDYTGPAHNGEIYTDKKGHDYIYYARWNVKKKNRNLWLQRLYWDKDGWPYFKHGTPAYKGRRPRL